MKTFSIASIVFLFLSASLYGQPGPLVWTKPVAGKDYQLFSLKQPNGGFIGICRGSYQGGVFPGKIVGSKCLIGYGGNEVVLSSFEVFEPSANPNIKINDSWKGLQFQAGVQSDGKKVFLCYAIYQNTYQPGKSFDGKCFFTWNGLEQQATSFLQYFYETVARVKSTPTPVSSPANQPKAVPSPTPAMTEKERAARATDFVNYGLFNYRGKKYAEAADNFTEYLKLYPGSSEGYYNRGVVYRDWGKTSQAIADFQQALKLTPDFARAKTELDKLQKQRADEQVTSISQVSDVKPTDSFFADLQSLIEKFGISRLTTDKKFNPNKNLTMFEYAEFLKQGKATLRELASAYGLKEIDEEKLFNSKCTLPYLEMIPEKEISKSLSCNFRIKNFSMPGGEAWVSRGKFAVYFNKALEQVTLEYTLNDQADSVLKDSFSATPKSNVQKQPEKSASESKEEREVIMKAEKDLAACLKTSNKCYFEKAFYASMKDDNTQALKHISTAIAAEPKNVRYFSFRADLYLYDLDQYQNAWNDYSTLIGLEPKNGSWYVQRAYTACKIPNLKNSAKQDEARAKALGAKVGSPCL